MKTMMDHGNGGESLDETAVLFPILESDSAYGFVAFDRSELNSIFRIYGRMVAAGEWRDYAIDHLRDCAVFSIFRRTSEVPLIRVVKEPRLRRKQGMYRAVAASGQIIKRGHDLSQVLTVFDRHLKIVRST